MSNKYLNGQVGSRLLRNIGYLSILNGINLLVPLILTPYLISVLGLVRYGEIIYAQSIAFYFTILVGFGFNQIGAKEIALNANNNDKKSEILSTVYLSKGLLFFLSLILLILGVAIIDFEKNFSILLLLSLWSAFQEFLIPEWYFQGTENMEKITIISFISKIITVTLIVLFVKEESDFLIVPITYWIGIFLSGFFLFYLLIEREKIRMKRISFTSIKFLFFTAFPLFFSKLSQFYIRFNKVLVGFFIGEVAVAIFDVGEKIVNFFKIPITMIGQAYYPVLVKEFKIREFYKFLFGALFFNIIFIIVVHFSSEDLLKLLLGMAFSTEDHYLFLDIYMYTLVPVTINVFFGNLLMLSKGLNKEFMVSILFASIVFVIGMLFIYVFNCWSIANVVLVILMSEIGCSCISLYYYFKFKLGHVI